MARSARVQQFTIIMEKASTYSYVEPTLSIHVDDNMVVLTGEVSYTSLNSAMTLARKIARPRRSESERRHRQEPLRMDSKKNNY
jgi:hypothetical protein